MDRSKVYMTRILKIDRCTPVSEEFERAINGCRPKEDGDIPMGAPIKEERRNANNSQAIRRIQLYKYLIDMTDRHIDYSELLTLDEFNMLQKVMVLDESMTSVGREYGVTGQQIANRLFAPRKSVYSKIKYWYGRMCK